VVGETGKSAATLATRPGEGGKPVPPAPEAAKQFSPIRRGQFQAILFFLVVFVGAGTVLSSGTTCRAADTTSPAPSGTAAQADKIQDDLSSVVQKTANTIDGFFGSSRHTNWEENRTSLRLRFNFDFIEGQSVDPNAQVKLNLVLPALDNRVRLVMNPDDDDEGGNRGDDSRDESELALRFMGRQFGNLESSYDLGLRIKDKDLALFLRWNTQLGHDLGQSWHNRFTNQLYWYTDTHFRDDFRVYFERRLSERFFFRSRTRVEYFQEYGAELFPEQRFTLFQTINPKHALAYEALVGVVPFDETNFKEDNISVLDEKYTHYTLRLRYRTNVMFPWLFFELWPIVSWPEERDYETTYAFRFRVEFHFGYLQSYKMELDE